MLMEEPILLKNSEIFMDQKTKSGRLQIFFLMRMSSPVRFHVKELKESYPKLKLSKVEVVPLLT